MKKGLQIRKVPLEALPHGPQLHSALQVSLYRTIPVACIFPACLAASSAFLNISSSALCLSFVLPNAFASLFKARSSMAILSSFFWACVLSSFLSGDCRGKGKGKGQRVVRSERVRERLGWLRCVALHVCMYLPEELLESAPRTRPQLMIAVRTPLRTL